MEPVGYSVMPSYHNELAISIGGKSGDEIQFQLGFIVPLSALRVDIVLMAM